MRKIMHSILRFSFSLVLQMMSLFIEENNNRQLSLVPGMRILFLRSVTKNQRKVVVG